MKATIKYSLGIAVLLLAVVIGCTTEEYSMGSLDAPKNVALNVSLAGQNEDNPYGDGSGDVTVSASADNALGWKIDFGTGSGLVPFTGTVTKKYTTLGTNSYTITVVAYGEGGAATTVTKDIMVKSLFNPDPKIVSDLTGDDSKTWVVDKSVPGHFGVGPWDPTSTSPVWWAAGVNEKVNCCNCFYTATFTFIKNGENDFSLDVNTPDGAFTKTGALTNLPGIPDSGDEACYDYGGGSSSFSFVPSSSGISASTPSTQTSIEIADNSAFIGYGALQNTYEILEIEEDYLYLRVQGTETGNAWYLKLVPAS